jgi:ATP-dependent DNA helicase RecG
MEFLKAHGRITRRETADLCSLSEDQASRLLRLLADQKKIVPKGAGRGAHYVVPS